MLARIRKAMDEKDRGFTLIELLVVVIIIGILAAIAIPTFLNQKKKAVEAGMKSDLRSVANELHSYYTDTQAFPTTATVTGGAAGADVVAGTGGASVKQSDTGSTMTYKQLDVGGTAQGFCLKDVNTKTTGVWYYNSNTGGLSATPANSQKSEIVMLARIRKAMDDKDQGFTLIELLVVVIIIGILAAIAIPTFLNQKKKAVDAGMKSDLRTVANEEQSAFTDSSTYYAVATAGGVATLTAAPGPVTVKVSSGNVITGTGDADGFCVTATNTRGSQVWVYKSADGGLQPSSVTTC